MYIPGKSLSLTCINIDYMLTDTYSNNIRGTYPAVTYIGTNSKVPTFYIEI